MVFTTEGLLEVAIESWPEWDLRHSPAFLYHPWTMQASNNILSPVTQSSFAF